MYSVTSSTDGCYPNTTVLINKLGLKKQEALDAAETVAVALHSAEIESELSKVPFTFMFYRELHKRLFGDLYGLGRRAKDDRFLQKGYFVLPGK